MQWRFAAERRGDGDVAVRCEDFVRVRELGLREFSVSEAWCTGCGSFAFGGWGG